VEPTFVGLPPFASDRKPAVGLLELQPGNGPEVELFSAAACCCRRRQRFTSGDMTVISDELKTSSPLPVDGPPPLRPTTVSGSGFRSNSVGEDFADSRGGGGGGWRTPTLTTVSCELHDDTDADPDDPLRRCSGGTGGGDVRPPTSDEGPSLPVT